MKLLSTAALILNRFILVTAQAAQRRSFESLLAAFIILGDAAKRVGGVSKASEQMGR